MLPLWAAPVFSTLGVEVCGAVVAADTSARMIEQLEDKMERLGLVNVQPTSYGIEELARRDPALVADGFDFVVCSSVCAFVDDYPGTVGNLVRLLRPRGIFVQWDWEFNAQAKEPFGLTRDQIMEALSIAGLETIRIETAFEIHVGEKTMRPLMGSGQRSAQEADKP